MTSLSLTSTFASRYKGALFVVAFSFLFMALALAGKTFSGSARLTDVLLLILELLLAFMGAVFAFRFGRQLNKFKTPVVVLLVAATAAHLWMAVAYVDFSRCPFGSAFCIAVFYTYLAMLGVMAVLLAVTTTPDRSSTAG